MPGSLFIRSDSCGAEPGGGDHGYATPPPRKKPNRSAPIKTKTPIEGKPRQEAGGRFAPQPPALIDKVSRMSRNEVSRMSWNLTLKHAPPMRRQALPHGRGSDGFSRLAGTWADLPLSCRAPLH